MSRGYVKVVTNYKEFKIETRRNKIGGSLTIIRKDDLYVKTFRTMKDAFEWIAEKS